MAIPKFVIDMALKLFIKEALDPNSPVHKMIVEKVGDVAGNMIGSALGMGSNGGKGSPASQGAQGAEGASTDASTGAPTSTRSEEEIQAEMLRYRRNPFQMAVDTVLPAAANIAKGAGTAAKGYNSLLGNALMAVSQGLQSPGFSNPFAMAPAMAAGAQAKGLVQEAAGDTIHDTLKYWANDLKSNREKEQNIELLLREHPSGAYYEDKGKTTRIPMNS